MTTSDPAGDGQNPPDQERPPTDQPAVPEGAQTPADPASQEPPGGPATDEGLPEWEPLTPELVEDEAIRGDFVIRWAVVGLALLFGFAPIAETRTLVHIRTGEYLASHGLLPPATDVFSYTASDRKWVNLAWLFDLLAAGVHALAGGIGLSVLQGILAGLAFGLLVHTARGGIRTWWGSICAALALLVCYPQFTIQPELITLVGLAGLMWVLLRVEETGNLRLLWSTVPLVWLWSQFDPRAFLGWLLLLCMALGETLRSGDGAKPSRALWWQAALASLAVTALHPFHYESWLSPLHVFGIDYSALRHAFPRPGSAELPFHPITAPAFWASINHDSMSALVLLAATIVSLVLNRERVHPGHVVAVVIFNLLGGLATHELAAASLVNCVVCTVNAQTWYRQRFGQVYSVDWRELLFSRGGRAATVVCLFALAWLVISGRIDGPAGRRTGLGFDEGLQVQMDSYRQLAGGAEPLDDRPFHFAMRQGDLLIWSGQKSFIDMRAGLFHGAGDRDLIGLHDRTRRAMQQKRKTQPGSGEPQVWKATLDKYHVTHAMPRLSGPVPAPDYLTFGDLLSSADWALTELAPSAGVFYRTDTGAGAPLKEYVAGHRLDFGREAFRTEARVPETARVCAKSATWSDNLFAVRAPRYPAGIQQAAHYVQLAGATGKVSPATRAACALLGIRHSAQGLREDSNSARGYHTLGLAYLILDRVESSVMGGAGVQWFNPVRYYQQVAALRQASLLQPDDTVILADLLGIFERTERSELALDCIRQIRRQRPVTAQSSAEEREERGQLLNFEYSLEENLAKIEGKVEQGLLDGADRFQVAAAAYQAGAVLLAIRTLEEAPIYKEQHPAARTTLGMWLIEAGRIQEGLDSLEQSTVLGGAPGWRNSLATALLVNAEYSRAIELWRAQIDELTTNSAQAALLTMPFVTLSPVWMGADQYPFTHMASAGEIVGNVRAENAALTFQIGLAQLEQGDLAGARKSLQHVFDRAPQSHLKPLLTFYLEALTDKTIDAVPQEPPVLEEFEPLGEEASPEDIPRGDAPANVPPAGNKGKSQD